MKRMIFFSLLVSLILTMSGCGDYKKLAVGRDEAIITLAEDSLWARISDTLKTAVEKELRTPQYEKLFYFKPIVLSDFSNFKYHKNLFLVATLEASDPVSNFVKDYLPAEGIERVKTNQQYMFTTRDHMARRQQMNIIIAPNADSLFQFVANNGKMIYDTLDAAFSARMMDQLYYKAEETDIEQHLLNKYGFSLRLQNNYIILEENPREHVIHLGKGNPNRWITIFWREGGFRSILDDNWAWKTRYWMGKRLMDNTYIEKDFITRQTVDWNGRIVHNIRGLWAHPEKAMGGPFSSFYFYDGVTDRVYFIDMTVWAPGESKNVYLRQMEIMASTFTSRSMDKYYKSLEENKR